MPREPDLYAAVQVCQGADVFKEGVKDVEINLRALVVRESWAWHRFWQVQHIVSTR